MPNDFFKKFSTLRNVTVEPQRKKRATKSKSVIDKLMQNRAARRRKMKKEGKIVQPTRSK